MEFDYCLKVIFANFFIRAVYTRTVSFIPDNLTFPAITRGYVHCPSRLPRDRAFLHVFKRVSTLIPRFACPSRFPEGGGGAGGGGPEEGCRLVARGFPTRPRLCGFADRPACRLVVRGAHSSRTWAMRTDEIYFCTSCGNQ